MNAAAQNTTSPAVRGWCPGALRPMLSGDGLVVRLRPRLGRLTREQAAGAAELAVVHGNGMLDLSSRANLQMRGVSEEGHEGLLRGLRALDLLDDDAEAEARRNVLHHPFGAGTEISAQLEDALVDPTLPALSSKFGYILDAGPVPLLRDAPGDIRLERHPEAGLILCPDGAAFGKPVVEADAVPEMLALTRWFAGAGGLSTGRMRHLVAQGTALPPGYDTLVAADAPATPVPGPQESGYLVALAFGQMDAETLRELSRLGDLRLTPWRMVLIEGLEQAPDLPGVITRGDDPLLRVVACVGHPACLQARGETRQTARTLAPLVPPGRKLHVSGCAKGCAHAKQADFTLIPGPGGFDLVRHGHADARPDRRGLDMPALARVLKEEADAT